MNSDNSFRSRKYGKYGALACVEQVILLCKRKGELGFISLSDRMMRYTILSCAFRSESSAALDKKFLL